MGFAYSRIMNESFTTFKFRVEPKYTAMPIIVTQLHFKRYSKNSIAQT